MKLLEEYDSYLGFLDDKDARTAGRIKSYLEKRTCVDNNEVMQRRDFVLFATMNGFYPFVFIEQGKNAEYYLRNNDSQTAYKVKKTEYDFAEFIMKNNLNNETNAKDVLEKERIVRHLKEELAKEEAERKAEEARNIGKKREICRNAADKAIAEYDNEERIKLASKIYKDITGYAPEEEKPFYLRRILAYIENIDNFYCKEELNKIMHMGNPASRKIFECVTGLKLPKGNKATIEFIKNLSASDYGEMKEYKPRKKAQKKEKEKFYIAIPSGEKTNFKPVMAETLNKYSLKLFIFKNGEIYSISFAECGFKLCGGKTKTEAMESLKVLVQNRGTEWVKEQITNCIEKFGESPWIAEQEA